MSGRTHDRIPSARFYAPWYIIHGDRLPEGLKRVAPVADFAGAGCQESAAWNDKRPAQGVKPCAGPLSFLVPAGF